MSQIVSNGINRKSRNGRESSFNFMRVVEMEFREISWQPLNLGQGL